MTKKDIYNSFEEDMKLSAQCLTRAELIAKLGKTTLRCCFVDFVDYLAKSRQITTRQAFTITAPSWCY